MHHYSSVISIQFKIAYSIYMYNHLFSTCNPRPSVVDKDNSGRSNKKNMSCFFYF